MLHRPRVLLLDEPTAGVDVRSRGLFWEAIQDEAARGVTVFVTTHFMEEVDYCHRVSLIDAGRLIVDATPAEMRRRYSEGYRITVTGARDAALDALGSAAVVTDDAVVATVGTLDPALLSRLGTVSRRVPGAAVRIADVPMTEVFTRALREAAA
jgi:ABC-type multidrug transport system ATPase subunit